jgi:adenosine deaminase
MAEGLTMIEDRRTPVEAEVDQLPRALAELHLHLEGTLEPETIYALAERNDIPLPYRDLADLRAQYEFADLSSFLDLYYANMTALRTGADFETMTWRYLERAQRAGVRHAEVFLDPQAHTHRGLDVTEVLRGVQAALQRAEAELDISSGVIVCILRDRPVAEAMHTLDDCLAADVPVLGLGLDSAEVGYPPSLFAEVFAAAEQAGLRRVAHAGEEGPPDYIWQALDVLGVERIDHGVRSLEDSALVARLVADQIPLTVCPLSNVRLKVIDRLADHPLRQMMDAGLLVTVNSDDPAYFGGYVDDNLEACRSALGLTPAELGTLARNSIVASFATDERKQQLIADLAR